MAMIVVHLMETTTSKTGHWESPKPSGNVEEPFRCNLA